MSRRWECFHRRGIVSSAYYFRTVDQHELDLVLDFGKELWAIEVKLTSSPSTDDVARLKRPLTSSRLPGVSWSSRLRNQPVPNARVESVLVIHF